MPRFVYLGGVEFDETEMPAAVTIYGARFVEGVPTEITDAHAVSKLRGNKYFEEMNDAPGTQEVLEAPKPKRGRPAKPVFAEDITPIEDAAE